MDSLSQIVLGAATGELVLGKKLGNRALVLGAIGGTIPDLDVVSNFFMNEINSLDFHRGISHSILFTVVVPFLLGGIIHLFYKKEIQQNKWYRIIITSIITILSLSFIVPTALAAYKTNTFWALGLLLGLFLIIFLPFFNYARKTPKEIEAPSFWNAYWFFFFIFLTHIALDMCTTYGTQILMPFSNMRFSFNNVSVVDPLYTLPFLCCILLVIFFKRTNSIRRILTGLGFLISTGYLIWGVFNHIEVKDTFSTTLNKNDVEYSRFMVTPTIFNNFLWSGTIEKDSSYLIGTYSKFDAQQKITSFIEVPKNHHLIKGHENDHDIEILRRFSDNYYTIQYNTDSTELHFIDLRWGALDQISAIDAPDRFPLYFILEQNSGELKAKPKGGDPFTFIVDLGNKYTFEKVFVSYWNRIFGYWQ